jgi:hypothetical protein
MKAQISPCTIPSFILIAADRYPVALAAYLERRLRQARTSQATDGSRLPQPMQWTEPMGRAFCNENLGTHLS